MKNCHLPLLSFVLFFQSCGFIHFMGTKQIEDKTEQEVDAYLNKIDFNDYDYSFLLPKQRFDSLGKKRHVLDLWKYEHQSQQSTIQIRIYGQEGEFLNGYAQCYGDMKKVNILSEVDFKNYKQFPNNTELIFKDELLLWELEDTIESNILDVQKNRKYTFVIYWNVWSNYYSKIIFKKLDKYLKNYNNRNDSLIILVNTDNVPDSAKK